MFEPAQKCENNEATFKQDDALKLFIVFKMAYSSCVNLGKSTAKIQSHTEISGHVE